MRQQKPDASEYAPYYARYVATVPAGDIVETLNTQLAATLAFVGGVGEERSGEPMAPGKWSLKQVVGHIADTERVMSYRALCIARGDTTPLPSFDQDAYVRTAGSNERSLASLADELTDVRRATVRLLDTLPAEAWDRRGTASDNPVSVTGLAHIMAGHELHHLLLAREQLA
jgi:hypothetical protein